MAKYTKAKAYCLFYNYTAKLPHIYSTTSTRIRLKSLLIFITFFLPRTILELVEVGSTLHLLCIREKFKVKYAQFWNRNVCAEDIRGEKYDGKKDFT